MFKSDGILNCKRYFVPIPYRFFLSNCNGGTGEAIEFIELIAKCTKHMVIIKAQSMTGLPELKSAPQISGHNSKSTDPMALAKLMAREAVLSKLFKYLLKAMPLPKKEWIILGRKSH